MFGRPPALIARIRAALAAAILLVFAAAPALADVPVVTVGTLKFGTVNWELDVIKRNGLDAKHGFRLEVVDFAGNPATQVALQAEAVDLIVSDWLWVSRQRAAGTALAFAPHSTTIGAVLVRPDGGIVDVGGLKGKRIGVAGSPLDKSWLMLKAYALDRHGLDLDRDATAVFAAPPLLNQQMEAGDLDAVLNFWHFAARLEAKGMRPLVGASDLMEALGQARTAPAIGWVFRQAWAEANPARVAAFMAASLDAKKLLASDDAEWERVRPVMKAEDDATFRALRDRYRDGIPTRWSEADEEAARNLYALMAKLGGPELVGASPTLAEGTFWPGIRF